MQRSFYALQRVSFRFHLPQIPWRQVTGRIRKTGETTISDTLISKWRPAGLSPKFSKGYFKVFKIPFLGGKQSVGRLALKGNQERFFDDKRVVLPITSYDIVDSSGSVSEPARAQARKTASLSRPLLIPLSSNSPGAQRMTSIFLLTDGAEPGALPTTTTISSEFAALLLLYLLERKR